MNRILRLFILFCLIVTPSLVRALSVSISVAGASTTNDTAYYTCYTPGSGSSIIYFRASTTGCSGSATYAWSVYSAGTLVGTYTGFVYPYTITGTGNYTVVVNATCGGVTVPDTLNLHVHGASVIDFTTTAIATDTLLSCGPKVITFRNMSTGVDTGSCPATWYWIIDGVRYSGYNIPSQTFTAYGPHTVTLYFSNSCGCGGSITKTNFINIDYPATACFTRIDTTPICSGPATVGFDAACSSHAVSYTWRFGDGSAPYTTTDTSATHIYYGIGYFNDTLDVTSPGGCVTRVIHDSMVYVGNLAATMGASPIPLTSQDTVCQGASVTFSDSSYIGLLGHAPSSYDFVLTQGGVGVDSTTGANIVSYTFNYMSNPYGLFTVTDNITDIHGCTASVTRNLYVRPAPTVTSHYASRYYNCSAPLRDTLRGSANPTTGITYTWLFGDGTTRSTGTTLTTVYHTYSLSGTSTSGSFGDTLIVTDVHGCADTSVDSANIAIDQPHFHVTHSADSGCVSASNPLCFSFSINTASPTPSFTPFTIDSVAFDDGFTCIGGSCNDSSHCFATAGDTAYEAGFRGTTSYQRTGYHYFIFYWHLPAYLGGCSGSYMDSIRASGVTPNGHLHTHDTLCPHATLFFDDTCSNCTFTQWNIQAGLGATYSTSGPGTIKDTTSVNYAVPSTFPFPAQLIMTVNGCSDTLVDSVVVLAPDSGAVVTHEVCDNRDSVMFIMNTVTGHSSMSHYYWVFGDGTHAVTTSDTVYHHYTGAYSTGFVNYTVYDSSIFVAPDSTHRCYNTYRDSLHVGPVHLSLLPLHDTICSGTAVNFTGPMNPDGTPFNDYYWFWGDGTPGDHTSYPPPTDYMDSHVYNTDGTYHAYVIVINGDGCRDTTSNDTTLVAGPHGGLSVSNTLICAGETISFVDNNTDVLGIRHPHAWRFNATAVHGSTFPSGTIGVAGTAPFHTNGDTTFAYYVPGTYRIMLNDTDVYGCTSSAMTNIIVEKPHAYFYSNDSAPTQVCVGLPVSFTDTNTHCFFSWSFDGGASWSTPDSTAATVTHTYTANGTYSVRCAISETGSGAFPSGCTDTAIRTNYINVAPVVVSFTNIGDVSPVSCPPLHIGLSGDTTTDSYVWHVYPGGATYTGPILSTFENGSGTYTVTMVGTTPVGCSDSISTTYVIGGPSGYITVNPDSGCNPIPVTVIFHDTGIAAASSNYIWSTCPAGDTTTTSDTLHLFYNTVGTYCPPTVIITSGSCAVLIQSTDSMRVYPLPFVTLTHLPILCYDSVATISAVGADHYTWSPSYGINYYHPGDSSFVTVDPLVTTIYTVIGTTLHGCADTEVTTVTVDPELHIAVHGRDSMCIGLCDTLVVSGVPGASYIWSGTGTSCAVCDTNVVCITTTRTFTVSGTDAAGCSDETTFKVTVNPTPILSYMPDPAYICKRFDTTHLYVSGAESYTWKPRLYISCDSCSDPICSLPTNLVYTVTGTSKFGCFDSVFVPVTVYDTFHTSISPVDTSICIGQSVQFVAPGGIAWSWKPTDGSLSNPETYNPVATPTHSTDYTVVLTENVCFKDTLHAHINVVPLPTLQLPPNVSIIAGNSVQLYATATDDVNLVNWLWTPADTTLSCLDCPRPLATPTSTTTYSVVASTIEGCAGTGEVTITVLCQNSQIYIPNTFTPNGDGVNDRFYISGSGLGNVSQMAIYNRWGEQVYSATNIPTNDPAFGWDGTYKGQVLAPDVFVYKIIVLCSTGEPFSFQGDISIVR